MSRLAPLDSPIGIDGLARACFEREAAEKLSALDERLEAARIGQTDEFTSLHMGCAVVMISFLGGVVGGEAGFLIALLLGALGWIATVMERGREGRAGRRRIRGGVARGIAAYAARELGAVQRVHEFAVGEFRRRIAAHRDRTLGADSEWGRARASLAKAADSAQRSTAYWRERLRTDPDSELAAVQSRVARRLEAKLASAVEKADQRATALRRFYNDCEARLAVMDRSNRDMAESRQLAELSDNADLVIAGAEETIRLLARRFVAEAQAIAASISGAAEVGAKSLAGEAPLDNIEHLADAVIESSELERSAIEALERRLDGAG